MNKAVEEYTKKPVTIEAFKLHNPNDGENWNELNTQLADFMGDCEWESDEDGINITTLEGVMKANVGDYIIKGIAGEYYPCKPDIFEATYSTKKFPSLKAIIDKIEAEKVQNTVTKSGGLGWKGTVIKPPSPENIKYNNGLNKAISIIREEGEQQ